MTGYYGQIEKLTLENENFRKVLFTGKHTQLVLMSLKVGEEIGAEVHDNVDQFFRFEAGEGKVVIDDKEHLVKDGDAVIVPAGANHNVVNTSPSEDLKLYTLYSPANHPEGTIHVTKAEADEAEEHEHH
jgi:mannose-6-phosphate isomerase-like protein (cupin superfamily)